MVHVQRYIDTLPKEGMDGNFVKKESVQGNT